MSGMMTSQTIRSGASRPICSRASFPDAADNTSMRRDSSARCTTLRTLKLSSTTSTLGMT